MRSDRVPGDRRGTFRVARPSALTVRGRERRWGLVVRGDDVTAQHYLVLEPGEEVDDTPPEVTMTRAEWRRRHSEFGLDIDGRPLEE